MTSRREFLQIGIAAGAWPLASSAARVAGAEMAPLEPLPIYKVVYDRRFAESVTFAERAAALGLPVHAIEGDMTRFWYDELYHRWKQGPVAIAGLTAHGPMFCFEQLGRDQGLRVVFRGEHKIASKNRERSSFAQDAGSLLQGQVEHALTGPLTMLRDGIALNERGAEWAACMAEVIAHCPQGRAEISRATAASLALVSSGATETDTLYSWVIAPAVRA